MEPAKGARKEKQQCIDTRTPPSYFNPPRPPHTLVHHIYVTFFKHYIKERNILRKISHCVIV